MSKNWKLINEFPRYEISRFGEVRDTKTNRIMVHTLVQKGIPTVGLVSDGIVHRRSVPLLVATHWLKNPYDSHFDTPIQLDGDRSNCSVSNLMWRPRWFAIKYHKEKLLEEKLPDLKVMMLETGEVFDSVREASIYYGYLEEDIIDSLEIESLVWPDQVLFEICDNYIN